MNNKLEIYKGNSQKIMFTLKKNNLGVDITNYQIWFTVKKDKTAIQYDIKKQAIITNAVDGEALFMLESTETSLNVGSYYYEITIVNNSEITTAILGDFVVKQGVFNG